MTNDSSPALLEQPADGGRSNGRHRVVVIGSGATAMTIVPAMADTAAHVTMLQRSPTYVVSRPDVDPVDRALRKVLPAHLAYKLVRKKNITMGQWFYGQTRKNPDKIKQKLLDETRKHLGDATVEEHFTPTYGPWDQRLCLIPNGDLFDDDACLFSERLECAFGQEERIVGGQRDRRARKGGFGVGVGGAKWLEFGLVEALAIGG